MEVGKLFATLGFKEDPQSKQIFDTFISRLNKAIALAKQFKGELDSAMSIQDSIDSSGSGSGGSTIIATGRGAKGRGKRGRKGRGKKGKRGIIPTIRGGISKGRLALGAGASVVAGTYFAIKGVLSLEDQIQALNFAFKGLKNEAEQTAQMLRKDYDISNPRSHLASVGKFFKITRSE